MEKEILPLNDIVEVVLKPKETEPELPTEPQADAKAEVEPLADSENGSEKVVTEIADSENESEKVVTEIADSEVISLEAEPKAELIESDIREDEDKKRDAFLAEARDICDSADFGVSVKMPHLEGRHSYRSALYNFVKLNPQFVSKKYANLRLDSYNNELCDEVKNDIFANIAKSKPQIKNIVKGFVDTGKGYLVMENF